MGPVCFQTVCPSVPESNQLPAVQKSISFTNEAVFVSVLAHMYSILKRIYCKREAIMFCLSSLSVCACGHICVTVFLFACVFGPRLTAKLELGWLLL